MMGSVASNESAYLILGMDFLMNIYNACKIISKFKKSKDEKSGKLCNLLPQSQSHYFLRSPEFFEKF